MTASGFPPDVEQFVAAHLSSVEQLEVLLLLYRTAPRRWSAVAASRELRIDPVSAARRLADFQASDVIAVEVGAEALEYWYAPRGAAPERVLAELERGYRDRRTSLINLIFAAPVNDVRVFSEAFRLRKPREES